MRNKATLMLMEQMLMILVFAMAAALCLRVFAAAWNISDQTARREEGAFLAQSAAELLKQNIPPETMCLPQGYSLILQREDSGIPGLATGTIRILWENTPVFSLETGWQEDLP